MTNDAFTRIEVVLGEEDIPTGDASTLDRNRGLELTLPTALILFLAKAQVVEEIEVRLVTQSKIFDGRVSALLSLKEIEQSIARIFSSHPAADGRVLEFPTRYFGCVAILANCDPAQKDDELDHAALSEERSYSFLLRAEASQETLRLIIWSRSDKVSLSFAHEILHQLRAILRTLHQSPSEQSGADTIWYDDTTTRSLVESFQTSSASASTSSFFERFLTRVENFPNASALEVGDTVLTYRELERRSANVARRLQKAGAKQGDLIGLLAACAFDSVIGMLGTLRSGAAFVPLDVASPTFRLVEMLTDAGITYLLSDSATAGRHPNLPGKLILLDSEHQTDDSEEFNFRQIQPESAAYGFFTSGSTGTPKAALISHKSLARYVESISTHFELKESDRVLQVAALSFDVIIEEVFPTLAAGACLVTTNDSALDVSQDLSTLIDKLQITVVELTTAYWHRWVERLSLRGETPPNSLRLVIVGGAHVSSRIFSQWTQFDTDLLHVYGTTETTCTSTVFHLPANLTALHPLWRGLPIGKPLECCRIYILDEEGRVMPPLLVGEICIAGDGVGLGYINRPELTSEKFVLNHRLADAGSALYRTGDEGRLLPDGNIEFFGRRDSQLKIRGYRIELREIEHAFRTHSEIKDVTVFPVSNQQPSGESSLGALAAVKSTTVDSTMLRDFLATRLPKYMIPAYIQVVDELPMLPNGKIDQHGARQLIHSAFVNAEMPAHDDLKTTIYSIFRDVLGHSHFEFNDSLFEIGGDSLSLMEVATQLSDKLGQPVSDLDVYMNPTINGLTQFLQGNLMSGDRDSAWLAPAFSEPNQG